MKSFVYHFVHLALLAAILVSPNDEDRPSSEPSLWYRQLDKGIVRVIAHNADHSEQDQNQNKQEADHIARSHKPTGDSVSDPSWRPREGGCDFGGQHLPIAVSQQPPLVNCFQNLYGDWMCNGSNIEVIRVLESRLNFRADWLVLSNEHLDLGLTRSRRSETAAKNRRFTHLLGCDLSFGGNKTELNQTSTNYTGVLGIVGSGRACLSANGIMRTKERERDFIFSEPFDSFRLHLLLSKWVRDHDHIFMKPFNANTWLAIITSAFIIVPIFYLVNTTSFHYRLQHDKFLARLKARSYFRYVILNKLLRMLSSYRCGSSKAQERRKSSTSSFSRHLEKVASSGGSVVHHLMLHHHQSVGEQQSPAVAKLLMKREQKLRRKMMQKRWALERRAAKRARKVAQSSGFFRCAYIIWYVAGSLAGQGGETEDLPRASSTRILVAFWWLYLIVITSIHSGILTAILTFPKQNDFIQTLDDFLALKAETMHLAVERSSELAQLMSSPDNLQKSPLQVLFKPRGQAYHNEQQKFAGETMTTTRTKAKLIHHSALSQTTNIKQVDFQRHRQRVLDEVQRGQSAYLEEKAMINLIISQEYFDHKPPRCLLKSSRYPVDTVPMAFVLSKHLPEGCVEAMNGLLRRIMEAGLAQKWRRRYEPPGNDCLNTVIINAGDVEKIQFRHVELAFWLLLTGLLFGSALLLVEIVWLFSVDMDDDEPDETSVGSDGADSTCSSSCSSSELLLGAGSGSPATSSSDSSSSNSNSSDDEDRNGLMLGHRRFLRQRRKLRVVGRQKPARLIHKAANDDQQVKGRYERRRRKRAMRAAERRARLLRRTVQLARRLHQGKIYSDLFVKFSHKFQAEAGRKSLPANLAKGRRGLRADAPTCTPLPAPRRGQLELARQGGAAPIRQRRVRPTAKVAPLDPPGRR